VCFDVVRYAKLLRENSLWYFPEKPLFYKKKIPDSFMLDNSVIISIVTDMLNEKWNPKSIPQLRKESFLSSAAMSS
jgi:hypothetical protein